MGGVLGILTLETRRKPRLKDSLEDEFEMVTVRHRPEGLGQLLEQTKFSKKELQILYRGFKNECPSGVVNEETFKEIYSQFFPQGDASMYAHFLFNAFDADQDGTVSFEDFVTGLSILLRGNMNEKLQWAFNLYDINKDGYISKEEMLDIMKSIYNMMGKCTYPSLSTNTPRDHMEKFFQGKHQCVRRPSKGHYAGGVVCQHHFQLTNSYHLQSNARPDQQKMDRNRDGVVTIDEFIDACKEDSNIVRSLILFEKELI